MVRSDASFPARFLQLTEQLLAAARGSDWETVNSLAAEREQLLAGQPEGPWNSDERRQLALARELNEQAMALTNARLKELREGLRPLQARARLQSRYG